MRRTNGMIAFWVAITLGVLFIGWAYMREMSVTVTSRTIGAVTPAEPAQLAPRVALFIGDDYLPERAASGTASFARQTCYRLSWVCYYDARRGTGYVNDSGSTHPEFGSYADRLVADSVYDPDLIVVSGGSADVGVDDLEKHADRFFSALANQFPDARVVVLEPFWPAPDPSPEIRAVREQVQRAAAAADVDWIRTADWLSAPLVDPDSAPTAAGNAAIAQRLTAALGG